MHRGGKKTTQAHSCPRSSPPPTDTHTKGGSCNSAFNGRTHSFHKSRRIKARQVKKAAGAKDKHLAELAARKDTKKVQKRRARDQRLREKEGALIEASMDVDGQGRSKKSADEKLGLALKKVGVGKKRVAPFLKKAKKATNTEASTDAGVRMEE